jgi:hypothetical protein
MDDQSLSVGTSKLTKIDNGACKSARRDTHAAPRATRFARARNLFSRIRGSGSLVVAQTRSSGRIGKVAVAVLFSETVQLKTALLIALALSGCAREDPARAELRARLTQQPQLSSEELNRTLDEVKGTLEGKTVRFMRDGVEMTLDAQQREVALGMLTERAGVFDEGLRTAGDTTLRILNAPGRSLNAENVATRRLLVDVETFVPRRFEYSLEFPDPGTYELDLIVE